MNIHLGQGFIILCIGYGLAHFLSALVGMRFYVATLLLIGVLTTISPAYSSPETPKRYYFIIFCHSIFVLSDLFNTSCAFCI